jgi:hypothetical protein
MDPSFLAIVLAGAIATEPPTPPPAPAPVPGPAPVQGPAPAPAAPAAAPAGRPMLQGSLKAELRGAFIVNLAYNDGTLYPGNVAYFGLPAAVSSPQFIVSPANTVVGFKLSGLTLGRAEISGAMDVNLRSPTPLITANALAPQFYDVHMQLEFERWRLIVGQFPDVLLPFAPETINSYPAGYIPGALGYVHPQVRGDVRVPLGERFQVNTQLSINRPIQTFDLSDEIVGRQAGVPDVQARVSIAYGQSPHAWQRPWELGVAGHWGRRAVTNTMTLATLEHTTWSLCADLRLLLPTGTRLKARWWTGALLGDFAAGIFQTVNIQTYQAIRASGLWFEVQQALADRWRVTAGYGRDDPRDDDLPAGGRSLNQAAFANLLWDVTKTVGLGLEGSRWATSYVDATTTKIWREESLHVPAVLRSGRTMHLSPKWHVDVSIGCAILAAGL